jgi:hypothetical protein
MGTPGPCVAHLVRKANGPDALATFLHSYRTHAPGADHLLLLILKGFGGREIPGAYRSLLEDLPHRAVHVPEGRFDVGAYDRAVRQVQAPAFLLLNSFSEILADEWLSLLGRHLREGVGVVAASASHESVLGLEPGPTIHPPLVWPFRSRWRKARRRARRNRGFVRFPNPHVRTNAFLLRRETWLALDLGALGVKQDARRFESGVHSLTRQVQAMGLRTLVAGRNGRSYAPDAWAQSFTFRSGRQENLIVADNRTRQYEQADAEERRQLAQITWGDATLADRSLSESARPRGSGTDPAPAS